LLVAASGCPNITTDPGEGSGLPTVDGPTVEFDPANAILPFPNNLVLCQTGTDSTGAPCTIGKVAIPPPACETDVQKEIRTGTLNQLDGFGTFEAAMQVTFTEPVDAATLDGNIVMYQRTNKGTSNDPGSAQVVPVALIKDTTLRFKTGACATPATIDAVTIVPKVPLTEKSTYTVAVMDGVKTASGKDYLPSFTWALVRQKDDPVTLDSQGNIESERTPLDPTGDANHNGVMDSVELKGLDQLWKAHAMGMGFLEAAGKDRAKVLVAWEVTTQTTTDVLDPTVAGSPASTLQTSAFAGLQSITCNKNGTTCTRGIDRTALPYLLCNAGDSNTLCFLEIALGSASGASGAGVYTAGQAICAQVGCANVADVLGGAMTTANYQQPITNPIGGTPIPGAWTDPLTPTAQGTAFLEVLAFVPVTAGPVPTVIFGHGLTSSKNALFAFAPQLATAHFASVAIDFVDHGSRAVQITTDAALGCNGTPPLDPTALPQCFQPIFGPDLAQDRDNIRQTILDLERLVLATKACGATGCQSNNTATQLQVDTAHIVYAGQSLGGIFGTTTTAIQPDITSGLLDVPSVGLLDTIEHTDNFGLRCQLVDALIDKGVLVGDKWNKSSTAPTGLCSDESWQMQPGYLQFAPVARWVIDPADGANYMAKLVAKKFFIQEVVDDHVVPNYATDIEGALGGVTPAMADPYAPGGSSPSAALVAAPTSPKWLRYPTLPATDVSTAGFGNLFEHPSLLRPAVGTPPEPGHCATAPANVCGSDTDCGGTAPCIFPGQLGTKRMQLDALTFLSLNH
jgi:pimeloyl-ACP methyl ester carboxylesterase